MMCLRKKRLIVLKWLGGEWGGGVAGFLWCKIGSGLLSLRKHAHIAMRLRGVRSGELYIHTRIVWKGWVQLRILICVWVMTLL